MEFLQTLPTCPPIRCQKGTRFLPGRMPSTRWQQLRQILYECRSRALRRNSQACVMFPKRRCHSLTPLQCMAWAGRRDKRGLPVCLFDMAYLTSNLDAYKKSCDSLDSSRPAPTGVPLAVTLRSLTAFDGMVRFVLLLCSLVDKRPSLETPIFQATVIADISEVSLIQMRRIRSWLNWPDRLPQTTTCPTKHQQRTNLIDILRSSVPRHTFLRFGNGQKTGWILSQPPNP